MSIAQPTPQLPFSPLASPAPDQSSFPDTILARELLSNRRPIFPPTSYTPFRSSPLATLATTIRLIRETGEMEMEDAEEQDDAPDTDDLFTMDDLETVTTEDDSDSDMSHDGLPSIHVDAPFRAGTPTPVVTPPTIARWLGVGTTTTTQRQRPQGTTIITDPADVPLIETYEEPWIAPLPFSMLLENVLGDGQFMEMDVTALGEMIESSHEISTEELDTEFLDIRRRNFWNSWLRYLHRKQQQQGIYTSNIGHEWSDLVAALIDSRPTEITEEEYDEGADMQGLRWGIGEIPVKDDFREKRVQDYGSLIVKPPPQPPSLNPAYDPSRIHNFYKFRYTNLQHRCSLHHFQLRYLLSATSKNDLYYIYENSLRRWDTLTRQTETIYNLNQSRQAPWKGWMPSTLCCRLGIAAIGGYSGEYAILPLNVERDNTMRIGALAQTQFITNHVDILQPRDGGATRVVWANNDCKIRQQDVETGQFVGIHELNWPINATCTSPDGRIRAAVGDAKEVVLMDANRREVIKELWGHNHWSFAVDWRNDGYTFVTGNQDMSARLWDARKMSESFLTLPARMGAIRSVHFSPDGKYLAIAEPADFVHIYDASTGLYEDKQSIEFIGETAGVSFDPSGERLFIGNADDLVGSIYEFARVRGREAQRSWQDIVL